MEVTVSHSVPTRVIHLTLLLAVLTQLGTSQFMSRPFPGEPADWTFDLHQYLGLASLGIIVAFWVWVVIRQGETRLSRLLPWFSASALAALWADTAAQLRRLTRLQAPSDEDGALASAVHGLGLLVISIMALSGTLYFVLPSGSVTHTALTVHKAVANLTWAYLIGHAGLAVLHYLLGSDIFSRMFLPGRRRAAALVRER